MSNGARFIEYKGKEIYFVDYTDIKSQEEFLKVIKSTNAFRENARKTGKRNVLILVDITGSYVYGETLDALKRAAKLSRELSKKEAIVGVTGPKKVMLRIVQLFTGMQLRPFVTLEEAQEWLIQE
jgi:SpoIIAA-like